MRHNDPNRQDLIDDMAVALCDEPELGDDGACARRLARAGFHAIDIARHLDTARTRARRARLIEVELWNGTQFK